MNTTTLKVNRRYIYDTHTQQTKTVQQLLQLYTTYNSSTLQTSQWLSDPLAPEPLLRSSVDEALSQFPSWSLRYVTLNSELAWTPLTKLFQQRTNSYSSEFSTQSTASSTTKASRSWFKAAPQPVNNVTYCGRHSSQFLFGGPSLADLARAMLGKD